MESGESLMKAEPNVPASQRHSYSGNCGELGEHLMGGNTS